MLAATISSTRCLVSSRCQPMCGVSSTLSSVQSGLSAGGPGGGADPSPKTSSAAPAIRRSRSACTSAGSSMIAPRAVLIT
eukprot:scaffold25163_cov63-Phaeocystis_antarctica.AAC.5